MVESGSAPSGWTELTVWLMRQGIRLHFGRYRHPQTQGKVERFHGALEMARRRRGLPAVEQRQEWLEEFRWEYNQVRAHEALGMRTPASGYTSYEIVLSLTATIGDTKASCVTGSESRVLP